LLSVKHFTIRLVSLYFIADKTMALVVTIISYKVSNKQVILKIRFPSGKVEGGRSAMLSFRELQQDLKIRRLSKKVLKLFVRAQSRTIAVIFPRRFGVAQPDK